MTGNKLCAIFLCGVLLLSVPVLSQDTLKTGWANSIVGNLNFSQSSFSNWTQGGDDNFAGQLDVVGKFVNNQKKYNWANSGKISYGRIKISDQESRKSADEIRLESVYTYKLGTLINPYVAVTGVTQFTTGYDYKTDPKTEISKFLDPGYFTQSIGVGYEPGKDFKTRLGAAFKETVADKFAARYSDDPKTLNEIEKVRFEPGIESVTDFSRKLSENILFTTKLELFSNVKAADEIDVRWDNIFSAKISKFIGVGFNYQLLYDKDISLKRQVKQVLSAGLTYAFL